MKLKICLIALLFSYAGFSQSISEYKYVMIPSKFKAQKKTGQFGLNALTKLFMEKNGYIAYLDTEILPESVTLQSCDKIYVDVEENNNMMTTKLKVVIKDCRNAVLFVSEEGKSSEKDNHVAYNQALRAAFKSFDKPEFRHDPNAEKSKTTIDKPQIQPAISEAVKADKPTEETKPVRIEGNLLFAQPIENGFQLVDNTPKVVMKIYKTSQPNVFLAPNGTLVKKDAEWIYEYYENGKLVSQPMNIKF